MVVSDLRINGEPTNVNKQFSIRRDGFVIDGVKRKLDSVASVSGKCTRAVVPREAVGYGNVKFVTMIGAFVGWQAVLVTTLSAFGIVAVMKRFLKGNTIPFTPFLALGALIFILFKLT
jgi:leader peptidase (prepilin peptidase)/N-methyltransferase